MWAGQRVGDKSEPASTLSDRSLVDSQARMGHGTTRSLERVLASCGLLTSVELEFVAADDVPNGGCFARYRPVSRRALTPHAHLLQAATGILPLESIFLALALLALVRCRSLEQSRYLSPGEWGKLLGLDRLPEVKTCGEKSPSSAVRTVRQSVAEPFGREWMAGAHSESVGLFYADGHVRVYHGSLTICHGARARDGSACGTDSVCCCCFHEFGELGVGDIVFIHPEPFELHLMCRPFVGETTHIIRSHGEFRARDPNHPSRPSSIPGALDGRNLAKLITSRRR